MKAAVILASLAIVGLAAVSSGAKVNQLYPVKRTHKLGLKHFVDSISVQIPGTEGRDEIMDNHPVETQEAPKVVELLAKTEPKDKVVPVLKFSIDDLLKLNEWTADDCNDSEFGRRRDICAQFFPEGSFKLGPQEMESKTKEDYVHYNLGKYCWRVVHLLQSRCPSEARDKAVESVEGTFGFWGGWAIYQFENYVGFFISYYDIPAQHLEYFEKAVEDSYPEAKNKSKLREICQLLVAKLKEFYDAKTLDDLWASRVEKCSVVNRIPEDK